MNVKKIATRVLSISPKWLENWVRGVHKRRTKKAIAARMDKVQIDDAELERFFDGLPVAGDVMIHSSVTKIGNIEGGTGAVVEQIIRKFDTNRNTVLVPALPLLRGAEELPTHPTFDVRTAPIKMGALANRIAQTEGAWRSIHPTHSVVALGKDAQWYTATHHLDRTPFGANSPYYKLLERNAKIFYFGVNMYYTTYVHVIEDMLGELFPIKVYADTEYDIECIDWDGNKIMVHTPVHTSIANRDVNTLSDWFEKGGAIEYRGKLGDGEVILVDVRKLTIAYLNALLVGETIYGRLKISDKTKVAVQSLLDNI